MLRRASLLVPLVLLLGRPGQAEAGPVMIPVNTTMANANGMLNVTTAFRSHPHSCCSSRDSELSLHPG